MDVKVTVENYGKILKGLEPRLSRYKQLWAHQFKRDMSDIEEDINFCLLDTIKLYRKEKGTQFESFFIMRMHHTLFNTARSLYKEKTMTNPNGMLGPCDYCWKKSDCLGTCAHLATFRQGRRFFNALQYAAPGYDDTDFTQALENKEHASKLIQLILQNNPKYADVIEGLRRAIMNGVSEEKAVRCAVLHMMADKNLSKQFLYKKINRLRKWLEKYTQMLNV